jgi:predicted RNA-binding protein YlxR (DUF448 family)
VEPVVTTSGMPAPGPVRTCVGCRTRATRSELLRVIAGTDSDGRPAVVPDPARTAPGRGAHVHPTLECYALAERRRAFTRALRPKKEGAQVGLSSEPLKAYLDSLHQAPQTNANDQRNWSTSS